MTLVRTLEKLLPRKYRSTFRCSRLLADNFGHVRSRVEKHCCDQAGQPLPWYTYPAIEYLQRIDFEGQRVFEYGSGNSTLFWSARAAQVVSVEHDESWYERVRQQLDPRKAELRCHPNKQDYVRAIAERPEAWDVIVVDGQWRAACAEQAVPRLAPGGCVVLDNADWHPRAAEILRSAGLIEIDFSGFGPLNDYTWTTSLFLQRQFQPRFLSARHPLPGIGALDQLAEEE